MIKRVPHCSHWGAYTILVENQKIIGVEPFSKDPEPSPIIHSIAEWAKPERRVLKPLVRSGWLKNRHKSDTSGRGNEPFIPVSWELAEELVAGEIDRVAKQYGNASIFAGSYGWTSCGRFHHAPSLLKRMLNLVGGYTGHVDTYSIAAGPVILRHTLGDAQACGGQATTLAVIAKHTDTLVVFGAMSPRTAQTEAGGIGAHRLGQHLKQIADRGTKVILVSPCREDLPDWMQVEWWPIKPNTDTALMLALAGEIVQAGRQDNAFLKRYTSGAEQLLAYLRGESDGTVKTADWAATICGLDAEKIRGLAKTLVDTRSMLTVSWALQRAQHGEQPFWAALSLATIIGQIGLPGGGVGYGYGSLGGVGGPIGVGKSVSISQLKKPIDSFIPVARISDLLLNPGKTFTYEGETRTYPDTRLVYWAGGNPFHHHQDLNRLSKAWTKPETIIIQDPMMTATARRADIVLPASTSIERNDIAANKRTDFILSMQQAIEPLGESRSDYDIFSGLANKLNVGEQFTEGRSEMQWLRHLYNESRDDSAKRLGFKMPDFDTFWAEGYTRAPVITEHTYLADFREDPKQNALATESGKIVLGSKMLKQLNYDNCPAHASWIPPTEWLGVADSEQLHLISHQPAGRLHSQLETGAASLAERRNGRAQLKLHTKDAASRGIEDGQTVRLWNERGSTLAAATVTEDVREGVAILPTGAWFTPTQENGLDLSGNPNVLTMDVGTSEFGQGCSAHSCLVNVEPYLEEKPDAIDVYQVEI